MNFIYDILLNFMDDDRIIEFYEWDSKDSLEHIKKIPLFKIKSIDMENLVIGNIKVTNQFLNNIENKTMLYKNKRSIKYAALFCDLNKVIAIEFSDNGSIISKSSLLLDEEEDIIDEALILDEFDFNYKIINKISKNTFLTRNEILKRRYLLKELEKIYNDKYYEKLNYLFEEVFGKKENTIEEKYRIIIDDIGNNYNNKYNKLYNIVRLSYQKK